MINIEKQVKDLEKLYPEEPKRFLSKMPMSEGPKLPWGQLTNRSILHVYFMQITVKESLIKKCYSKR